jgi:hypothetical protein
MPVVNSKSSYFVTIVWGASKRSVNWFLQKWAIFGAPNCSEKTENIWQRASESFGASSLLTARKNRISKGCQRGLKK